MNKIPLIIAAVVGVSLLGLIVYFSYNQNRSFKWFPSYKQDGDQPYDLGLLKQQLESSYTLRTFSKRLSDEMPASVQGKGSGYIYIGETAYYTEAEAERLLEFIKQGGKVLLATNRLPDSLVQFLIFGEECNQFNIDGFWRGTFDADYRERAVVRFEHPSLNTRKYEFMHENNFAIFGNSWNYIDKSRLCDDAEYPLASVGWMDSDQGENPNFVVMRVGEGEVYIHTNPILFTNYYFSKASGFEYLTKVFSHLDVDVLYWDRASSLPPPTNEPFSRPRPNNLQAEPSPMQYIYSQESLRWAWYVMLAAAIAYVLFHAKRRQRIIPIIQPNRNTSLEFVQTIGQLYFQQQDHRSIVLKQMQLFLSHLRQRYHIVLREWDDAAVNRIAIRSGVQTATIAAIFKEYSFLREKMEDKEVQVATSTLNRFYLLIEKFHKEEALANAK